MSQREGQACLFSFLSSILSIHSLLALSIYCETRQHQGTNILLFNPTAAASPVPWAALDHLRGTLKPQGLPGPCSPFRSQYPNLVSGYLLAYACGSEDGCVYFTLDFFLKHMHIPLPCTNAFDYVCETSIEDKYLIIS